MALAMSLYSAAAATDVPGEVAAKTATKTEGKAASKGASKENSETQAQLRTVVTKAKERLGDLEPWQGKLFDEEVVPQASRFVRDYRPGTKGLSAD